MNWFRGRTIQVTLPATAFFALIAMRVLVAAPKGDGAVDADRSDIDWAQREGSALLVLEPPALKGVTRWALESPRHRGAILSMALAPDGERLATGGVDGIVRIWNLAEARLEKALSGHTFHLHTMAWSPDGKRLATNAWGDVKLRIWNVESGKMEKEFDKRYHLRSLCWSADGKKLAGGTDGSGRIYVSDDLAEPQALTEIGQGVYAVAWSPDGSRLAVSSQGNPVSVIESSSGKAVYSLEQDMAEQTLAVQFSPDGSLLATGAAKGVGIWNAADGTAKQQINARASDVCWSPDGTRLAALSSAGLTAWDATSGKPAWKQDLDGGKVEWSAKTGRLAVVSGIRIGVRDGKDGSEVTTIDAGGETAPIFQAGRPVITGIGTPVLSLWDPVTLKRTRQLEGHASAAMTAAWSRDGKQFASADAGGTVRIWDVKAWEPQHTLEAGKRPVTLLEWSDDGKMLAAGGGDKAIRIWTAAGEPKATLEGQAKAVRALTWAPGNRQLASSAAGGEVIVWDAVKGSKERTIDGSEAVTALAWANFRTGPALAVGGVDGSIRVVNPATGDLIRVVVDSRRHSHYRTDALGWLPGDQPLILSNRFYLSQIWDASTGRTLQRQMAPGAGDAVFPTAGGSLIVSRCDDRTVRFWDASKGSLRGTLLEEGESLVAISTTGDVKFDPDVPPNLIAIIETDTGQQTITLDELAKKYGWKNAGKTMKLPMKN